MSPPSSLFPERPGPLLSSLLCSTNCTHCSVLGLSKRCCSFSLFHIRWSFLPVGLHILSSHLTRKARAREKIIQAYLEHTVILDTSHCNKASIAIKQAVIFLLVESLAFNLQKNATSGKCNSVRYACIVTSLNEGCLKTWLEQG